ncbi:unnamed protein product [Acanthocheilonema viteae]|uniref:Uncharacterized protein n=1 Tax=Acanthocheilonema viteae TaxID=6277 RepID=A0A498S4L4_ACAVI|nr:unnamed protein product [Acanthocheilonema viteae]
MNIMHEEHAENLKANAIKMLKLQGVSLTAAAMETISEKYSNSLKYLCLMGALVHTPDGAIYLKALCNLRCLCKLTLPPSLLSLSSKPLYQECRMLQQITVKYLCVYVYESEIVETRYFVKKLLPPTLKELCLHDPTHMVARDLKNDEFRKLHFKVTFCKRTDSLYQQEWMNGHCELLSHMVWIQPYKHFNTEYPHPVPGWWFFMSENVDTAEEATEVTAVEESLIPEPQAAAAQVQLPPNEDPGEMMMATIARFFERMIDDQLNAEFGGSTPTDLAILANPSNNVVSPNTASQLPGPSNGSRSGRATDRSRRSYMIISRDGRRSLSHTLGRTPSQSSTQSTAPTQTATTAERQQGTSITAESPDSEDSEEGQSNHDGNNNESNHFGSMTTTTASTTSNAGREGRNTRRTGP